MMCNVLKNWHPMIGCDIHDTLPPPGIVPVPKIPHVTAMILHGVTGLTSKKRADVVTASRGLTMIRGTDIGPLIPHVPVPPVFHYWLPLLILTSGSKSHFGASTVVTADGPVAIAVLKVVNLNLNCSGPTFPPMPSGCVVAATTHVTGVTWGDILAGSLSLVLDAAVQFVLNRLFNGKTGEGFTNRLTRSIMGPLAARMMASSTLRIGLQFFLREQIVQALPTVIAILVGSPLGYSPDHSPVGGYGGKGAERIHDAVAKFLNAPSVEQHPAQAPVSPASP